MPTVNFEFRDVQLPIASLAISVEELCGLESAAMSAALQRTLLYMCDTLRKSDVPTANVIAALLASAVQEYLEHGMLQEVERERTAHPNFPASLTVLGRFMYAIGGMMANQNVPPGLLGLAMMNAGLLLAKRELAPNKLAMEIETMLEMVRAP